MSTAEGAVSSEIATAAPETARAVQDPLAVKVQKAQEALHAKIAKKDAEIADLKKQLQSAKSSNTRVHKIPKPSAPRTKKKAPEEAVAQ